MINFERFQLDNGLKVLVHEDNSSPLAVMDIAYDVGARDEDFEMTGFAHLFEHLMFGGSVNIPSYDKPLENASGSNNAFTSNDLTNYYLTIPSTNLETGFWLESDRMLSLAFSEKSLEVQRNVVIEEYKQRYLNQPYGDAWLHLRPLAYKVHPYRWPTIGRDIAHIENAEMNDVKAFFKKYYCPANATLVIAGAVSTGKVIEMANKWFGNIPSGTNHQRELPPEPVQMKSAELELERDVPIDSIYKAYHMCARSEFKFHSTDLLSDILSNGKSSRFYQILVQEKKLFVNINAYVTGDFDAGLFVISGKLAPGVSFEVSEQAIEEQLLKIKDHLVRDKELRKVKNKVEAAMLFSEMNVLNKAMGLAIFELMSQAEDINEELSKYKAVNGMEIQKRANEIFQPANCSTLRYVAKNSKG
ncbi:MAG: peptidase M16 [Bacteroidetes bacterium]|nr:MAG: peptidase M16 [Bacteroidota bacterium]